MLVLSRKAAETILIDDRIQVTILQAKRGSVRIGIEAPREVAVVRGELRRTEKGMGLADGPWHGGKPAVRIGS